MSTPPGGTVYGPIAPTPPRPGSPRPGDPSFVGPVAPKAVDFESLIAGAPPPGAPLTLGRSPGSLNLSLPTNPELQTAARPDPWRGRDRFAAGNPTEITTLGEAFAKAGGDFEEAHSLSTQTQKLLAQGYTNDGTPVYDQATHIASLPKNFPDAPVRLSSVGKQLGTTATELSTRTAAAATSVNNLLDALDQKRAAWQTEWQAARNADGLIPFDKVDALLARRAAVAAEMQAAVNTTGTTIGQSVAAYEGILADGMTVLSRIGYVPPDALDAGPGDMDFNAGTGTAAAADVTDAVNAGADPGTLTRIDSANRGVALLNAKVAAGSPLTAGETQFLNAYYDRLATSGTFTRLEGAVQAAAPMAYPSSQSGDHAANTTLGTVANGLMNLSQVDDGKQVPASVTGLLNQPVGVAADPNNNGQSRGTDGRLVIAGLQQYEGTAGVLGRATVDGGESFTRQIGQSALRVKQELTASASFVDGMQMSTGDPDADAGFIAGEQQRHRDVADAGEPAINRILDVVARDTEASQSLLGVNPDGTVTPDAADRRTLMGAGWEDGSGASNVLRAATAPVQATPALADHSAALTRTIFGALGQDPQGWRELIPKGSVVSDTLTELTASRIDGFSQSPRTESTLGPAQPVEGGYRSFLRLGDNHDTHTDDRTGILKFIASGGDPAAPAGDADVQRIRTAADAHVVEQLTASLRHGGDGSVALNQAGNLDGIIGSSQYKALIDEHAATEIAAASLVQDRTTGLRMTERVLAVLATASLPSPVSALVKDPFNAAFDDALRAVTAAPKPTEAVSAASLFAQDNADYAGHRDYLVAESLTQAHQVPPGSYELLFENGRLRPYADIAGDLRVPDGSGSALSELRHMVNASRPGDTTWAKAFESTATDRGGYDPSLYTYAEPSNPLGKDTQQRIRQGDR